MANVQEMQRRRLSDYELRKRRERMDAEVCRQVRMFEEAHKATQGSTLRFA